MYDLSNVTSIVDSKATSSPDAGVRKAAEFSADEGRKAAEQSGQQKEAKPEKVKQAVEELNSALKSLNVQREFSVEESTNDIVVKILDSEKKEVIRQIPNEEALRLSQNIKEMVGLLYDSTS
jgi:flagellar protein FlaG